MDASSSRFFSDLCDKLRRNDPDTTQIMDTMEPLSLLSVGEEESSNLLGAALHGNSSVTDVRLCFNNSDGRSANSHEVLLNAIRTCRNLKHVKFSGPIQSWELNFFVLGSLACNQELEFVSLYNMALGDISLSRFLLGSGRIMSTFHLKFCRLVVITDSELQKVVTAFRDHQYLLSFHVDIKYGMFEALGGAIVSHPILRELIIDATTFDNVRENNYHHFHMPSVFALLCSIVESPHSALQHLQLENFEFTIEEFPFAGLVQSILVNQTLTKLTFGGWCTFDISPVQKLVSIYQSSSSNIQSLGFRQSDTYMSLLPLIFGHPMILGLKDLEVSGGVSDSYTGLAPCTQGEGTYLGFVRCDSVPERSLVECL